MSKDVWSAVDAFFAQSTLPPDEALDAAVAASEAAGLPPIAVTPAQGKFLHLLARVVGARSILEIGTLGGYSTIWLARALAPGGRLVTLEYVPEHAEVARANVARAGLADVVDVRVGRADETLPTLAPLAPFDLVFIDADKASIPTYFEWSLKLTRPGGVIVVDNVVRDGRVADADSTDPDIRGIRQFAEQLAGDRRVDVAVLQTVGAKSYDGFALALVNG